MTEQDAIEFGKKVIDLGLKDDTHTFCETAISALEKQIPKEPIYDYEKIKKHMNIGIKAPYCPICKSDVLGENNDCFQYCMECGQKLEWG